MGKCAIIFGVTGQDGSYLSELLLAKGYEVVGVSRRASTPNTSRIDHILHNKNFKLVNGDVTDASFVHALFDRFHQPYEIYNLAAQSHVGLSFSIPQYTTEVNYLGTLNILEAMSQKCPTARMYQASTSEMFGNKIDMDGFQRETTPFLPCSPYANAKVAAHHACRIYRESQGMFVSSGILFNHESARRGEEFVTRKITKWLARRKHGSKERLSLGNVHASRDWGFAGDYVKAMWLMLQQSVPDDYIIAMGETRRVLDFLVIACDVAGFSFDKMKEEIDIGDRNLLRPSEVNLLRGDARKAKNALGWVPDTTFKELVEMMVSHDCDQLES